MKTLKTVCMAIFISIVVLGFSANDNELDPTSDPVKISLKKACENRGLVYAINNQVRESMLDAERNTDRIIFVLRCNNQIYHVYASYKEWRVYFDRLRFLPPSRMQIFYKKVVQHKRPGNSFGSFFFEFVLSNQEINEIYHFFQLVYSAMIQEVGYCIFVLLISKVNIFLKIHF